MTGVVQMDINTALALLSLGGAIFAIFNGVFKAGRTSAQLQARLDRMELESSSRAKSIEDMKAEYDKLNESGSFVTRELESSVARLMTQIDSLVVDVQAMRVDIAVLKQR